MEAGVIFLSTVLVIMPIRSVSLTNAKKLTNVRVRRAVYAVARIIVSTIIIKLLSSLESKLFILKAVVGRLKDVEREEARMEVEMVAKLRIPKVKAKVVVKLPALKVRVATAGLPLVQGEARPALLQPAVYAVKDAKLMEMVVGVRGAGNVVNPVTSTKEGSIVILIRSKELTLLGKVRRSRKGKAKGKVKISRRKRKVKRVR